jgi:hypothetical protein
MARQQDQYLRTAVAVHVRDDDALTRSVHHIIFMITGGRIPSIKEMITDENGLRSMSNINPKDLIMSSKMWVHCGRRKDSCQWVDSLNMHQYKELIFRVMRMQKP